MLEGDICIIGAGPAGISLAREFDAMSFRVILLEGGNYGRNRAGQALYKGDERRPPLRGPGSGPVALFRGSSNCWGGFCRPLETHDFEVRDWVPNSGWPITRSDLMPYYQRAQSLFQLGPSSTIPARWERGSDGGMLGLLNSVVNGRSTHLAAESAHSVWAPLPRGNGPVAQRIRLPQRQRHRDRDARQRKQVSGIQVRTLGGGALTVTARHISCRRRYRDAAAAACIQQLSGRRGRQSARSGRALFHGPPSVARRHVDLS